MTSVPGVSKLQVRSRQVNSENERITEFTVYCPFRRRSVDIAECQECYSYEATSERADGSPNAIVCRRIGPPLDAAGVAEGAARAILDRTPVSCAMVREVVCVRADVTLDGLSAIFEHHGIDWAPVVDDESRAIGTVSRTDLLRRRVDRVRDDLELARGRPSGSTRARESAYVAAVMTPSVVSLEEGASLAQAAQLMAHEPLERIVVTERDGRIVGTVSPRDVLRWLARELPEGESID